MSDWYLVLILIFVMIPLGILFWGLVIGAIINICQGKKVIVFEEKEKETDE